MPERASGWPEITANTWLLVPRWDEFQHYKRRNPPWIKVHTKLLTNSRFAELSAAAKGTLLSLWLAYARTDGHMQLHDWRTLVGTNAGGYPQLVSLNQAGFLDLSASKLLALARADARSQEVEVENESPQTPLTPDSRRIEDRAHEIAATWSGGPSEEFEESLDQLERDLHARIPYTLRSRLWDEARKRERSR